MSNSNLLQQDATAWLLAIGQRLRVEYEDLAEPMPPRLTALLKLFEAAAGETVQQCSSHPVAARGAPPSNGLHTGERTSWLPASKEGSLDYTASRAR
jgi:hypothetical protein